MKTYEIEQTATAAILWKGHAATEQDALDSMAREVGYKNYADCCAQVGEDEGVVVREVR